MGATAGDLLARDLVCEWLEQAGAEYDIAVAPPFEGGIDWRDADAERYSHVVFVCGPFGNGWPLTELLTRFERSKLIAVNVSLLEPLASWNPFAAVFARDGLDGARPDISFLAAPARVPVVGVVLVHPQKEYEHGLHDAVAEAVGQLLAARDVAPVPLETRLDVNPEGLRTAPQVESVIARLDAVVTSRLHGLVLALKSGVPAVAIDPIRGGAKVRRQAETIGWPAAFTADALPAEDLELALDWCLTPAAREAALECAERARTLLADLPQQFGAAIVGA
jgi:hypothetical protein